MTLTPDQAFDAKLKSLMEDSWGEDTHGAFEVESEAAEGQTDYNKSPDYKAEFETKEENRPKTKSESEPMRAEAESETDESNEEAAVEEEGLLERYARLSEEKAETKPPKEEANTEISALKSEIEELRKMLHTALSPKKEPEAMVEEVVDEDEDYVKENFPELFNLHQKTLKELEATRKELMELKNKPSPHDEQSRINEHFGKIESAHPDALEFMSSKGKYAKAFMGWLKTEMTSHDYEMFQDALRFDPSNHIKLISLFKKEVGLASQSESKKLGSADVATKVKGTATAPPSNPKTGTPRLMTEQEFNKFISNIPKMSEAEFNKQQARYVYTQQQGRFANK